MLIDSKPISETCSQARSGWNRLFDREITPPDRADFETHLRSCAACRRYAAQLEAITATLRTLDAHMVESHQRILEPPTIPLRRLRRFSGLAACLILAVTVGGLVMLQLSEINRVTIISPTTNGGPKQTPIAQTATPVDPRPTVSLRLVGTSALSQVVMKRSAKSSNIHVFTLYPTSRVALGDRLRTSKSLSLPVTQENLK